MIHIALKDFRQKVVAFPSLWPSLEWASSDSEGISAAVARTLACLSLRTSSRRAGLVSDCITEVGAQEIVFEREGDMLLMCGDSAASQFPLFFSQLLSCAVTHSLLYVGSSCLYFVYQSICTPH